MLARFAFVVAVSCAPALAVAENWPEFRGPTAQGIAPAGKYPTEWSPTKNVSWKTAVPGHGWSSPVVWEGRVYLTTAVPVGGGGRTGDQSLRALCLDAKTGGILWDNEVFRQVGATAPRIHAKASHAGPTPVVDGKRVFVHFGHHGTACLDIAGKVLWRNTELRYRPVHGNGGSPILVDNLLVFSADGADTQFLYGLDADTGKVVWKTPRRADIFKKFSFSTPLLIEVEGRRLIVSQASGFVAGYDPKTGAEVWRVGYGEGYSLVPRPVFGNGLLFVPTGFDSPKLLAIRPTGKGDITDTAIAWSTERAAPLDPSPLLVGQELYLVSDIGVGSCLDAATGKVHWQQRLGGNHSASPTFADGKVYFQSEDGVGIVVKAGREYELLSKNEMGERTFASYAAADRAFYLRTEKHLYRIEGR